MNKLKDNTLFLILELSYWNILQSLDRKNLLKYSKKRNDNWAEISNDLQGEKVNDYHNKNEFFGHFLK
jgi:hypothetical protein